MLVSEAREHFIDVLTIFYGPHKHPDDAAMWVAGKAPTGLTVAEIRACADHLLEIRKNNSWPSAHEMIASLAWRPPANPPPQPGTFKVFVSSDDPRWPELVKRFKRERGKSPPTNGSKLGPGWFFPPNWFTSAVTSAPKREREAKALQLLRHNGTLAAQAVANRWAPVLIEFVTQHGREPSPEEERHLIAVSQRNDASVATEPGKIGEQLRTLRETMHQTAARRLGLTATAPPPPPPGEPRGPQPLGNIASSQRTAEKNLERLKAEALDPSLAQRLAASPQLLKSLKGDLP